MRFSIIIPVYNSGKFINVCVDSVIKQNWNDIEILLIDDGSTDRSGSIADEYSQEYSYIKSYHFENGGSVLARKRGAELAQGEYIVYLDSDDYLMDDYLSTLDRIINTNNHPDMIVLGFSRCDENGKLNGISLYNNIPEGIYSGDRIRLIKDNYIYDKSLKGMNYGSIHFSVCSKIIKRELYIRCQDYVADRISYGDDMVLTKYILNDELCRSIVVKKYNGYVYRDNSESMTNSISFNSLQKYEYAIIELAKTEREYDNRICVQAFRALFGVLSLLSQRASSYLSFISSIKESQKYNVLWTYARKAKIYKPSVKDSFKIIMVKMRLYLFLYFYFKIKNSLK